jgi:DNA-binding PadR family transcriptional regulator
MPAYLGEFEQLVLLSLLRLGADAPGADVRAAVEAGSGRTVWIGAVHTTLDRLLKKGLVRARVIDPAAPGQRRRRVYTLTADGRTALQHAYTTWARMTRGLRPRLEPR